jgi:hypothetical protein
MALDYAPRKVPQEPRRQRLPLPTDARLPRLADGIKEIDGDLGAARLRGSLGARSPNRRTAEPPNRRTAEPPNRRTAEPPNRRTAEPPNRRTAEPPNQASHPPDLPDQPVDASHLDRPSALGRLRSLRIRHGSGDSEDLPRKADRPRTAPPIPGLRGHRLAWHLFLDREMEDCGLCTAKSARADPIEA